MTKELIQKENRKLILSAVYGDLIEYDDGEIAAQPLRLNHVLLALKKVFGNIDLDGIYHKMLFQNNKLLFIHNDGQFYWDLTEDALENQSQQTQVIINNLLTT